MIIVKMLCFVLLSNCFLAAPIDDTMATTTTTAGDISAEMTTMSDVLQSQSTMKIIAENEISAEIGEIEATNVIQDDNEMTVKEIQDFMVNVDNDVDVDERKLESAEDEVKELKPETTTIDAETTTTETEIETTKVLNDTEEIQMNEFVVDDKDEVEHEIISTNIPEIDDNIKTQQRAVELVKEYSDEEYTELQENEEIKFQEMTTIEPILERKPQEILLEKSINSITSSTTKTEHSPTSITKIPLRSTNSIAKTTTTTQSSILEQSKTFENSDIYQQIPTTSTATPKEFVNKTSSHFLKLQEALNRGILKTILSLYFNGSPSYSHSAQSQISQSNPQQSTSESQRYEKFYEKSESDEKVIAYDFETKQYVYVDKGDEQQFNEHQTNVSFISKNLAQQNK